MTFELRRQDDNGNRFPASTFAERTSVEERLAGSWRRPSAASTLDSLGEQGRARATQAAKMRVLRPERRGRSRCPSI